MGFAIAEELASRGALVDLVCGPVSLKTKNPNINRIDVHSALEMHSECLAHFQGADGAVMSRSEEHTSELLSRPHLVCRLLLEKKKKTISTKPPLHRPMLSPVHSLDRWVG